MEANSKLLVPEFYTFQQYRLSMKFSLFEVHYLPESLLSQSLKLFKVNKEGNVDIICSVIAYVNDIKFSKISYCQFTSSVQIKP